MTQTDVLVVGAGPVGLFLTTELTRRGIRCITLERNPSRSTYSKALALMPRTLEIFEMAGLGPQFAGAVNRIDGVRFVTPKAQAFVSFSKLETAHPYIGILPQYETEAILALRANALGADLRYATELLDLRDEEPHIRASLRGPEGVYEISASYVVGCDGVRSTVRGCAGIAFEGGTYPDGALLADVAVESAVPANEARVHIDRRGIVTMFPMSDRQRRIVVVAPDEALPQNATAAWIAQRIRRAGFGATSILGEPSWSGAFRVHRRVASHMRRGRIFLAGDAAHTHSPVGGQGMNIGLHDSWNLGWKLAHVLAGDAPDSLLDTYEAERLPVARRVLRRTDLLTRALAHPNAIARFGRELLAPFVARIPLVNEPLVRSLSQLHVAYAPRVPNLRLRDGTRLYERLGTRYAVVAQIHGYPNVLLDGVDFFTAGMEDDEERMTLVRPDGYAAFQTKVKNVDDALRAVQRFLGETGIRITA